MGELAYKTMAGAAPRGLPQVYFCAHPDDKDRFLEQTAAELHGVRNCALWYDTGRPAPGRDWQLELGQMQLFVVTVTARFLHGDCRARQEELPFALQRHIPVLPILREPGLTGAFNALCGDLQALDPGTPDPTGIPYAHKLRRYLETVLIGDDLAAQVRRAFDAYLFLSYRKKDRRAALELMRLIHNDPLCRDVAIWYDEFLTAGRDFKSSIAQAMDQSLAVALVVTPRLNEDKNYVQRVEYPLARQSGKPVLPVEMEQTDRGELDKHFEGLPPCVPGRDEGALSRRLRECLGHAARGAGRDDPRQDYLMGLAYLGGIDVEVDPARAARRIGAAARAGYVPAIRKWAAMLHNGEAVERDRAQAVRWQGILAGCLRREWQRTGRPEDLDALLRELEHLGNLYLEQQRPDPAAHAWEEVRRLAEGHGAGEHALRAYMVLGYLWEQRNDTDAAAAYYQRCLGDPRATPGLRAGAMNRLGALARKQGDLAAARAWYEPCLRLGEEMAQGIGGPAGGDFLVHRYQDMTDLCMAEKDLPAAREWAARACALARSLAGRQDDLPRQQGLGHCLKRMADVCLKEGALAEAGACLAEAYSRVGRVERLDGTPGARQELAGICAGLGELRRRERDHASARDWWEQAVGLLQKGLCDETPRLIRARLAWALLDMGEECAALGQMGQAQRCCRRSHALWKELKETDPTVKSCKGMAVACTRMGDLSLEDGDAAQARARYEEAARLLEEVVARAPVAWARGALAEVCDTLGDLCINEGDVEAGAGWYSKAVAARRPPEP